MNVAPKIDVRNLRSVRRGALADYALTQNDWTDPDPTVRLDPDQTTPRRGLLALRKSAIARRIVMFNLIAMILLIAGVLYLNSSSESLAQQRARALVGNAHLIADVFEAQLPAVRLSVASRSSGFDPQQVLRRLTLHDDVVVSVYSIDATLLARVPDMPVAVPLDALQNDLGSTLINDTIGAIAGAVSALVMPRPDTQPDEILHTTTHDSLKRAITHGTQLDVVDMGGSSTIVVTTPILVNEVPIGVIAVATAAGEVEDLVRREREEVLRLFLIAIAVSIGLSLVLASTIAHPLADLVTAAEASHQKNARKMSPVQVRIPDFTARPDEIGRLSGALRGMVSALYQRIESNEQFAADVAHEVKNPLASLRSAVGTMRVAQRDDQRERLLRVIEHDVKRLDRLVSDIANASRLDSDLVKEEEKTFDLVPTLHNIIDFMSVDAKARGIEMVTDVPKGQIMVQGLEGRLAQVFVNLISNALSFCTAGDAVRIWIRNRENRVLVVVEDTGPGVPDDALQKIFERFYSERPAGQFGNNSGLGLAISKQIVEAHGGVIWAENIRPNDADPQSPPSGARFVVGLPL
jgi:two-component system, OmpR family, sensor histidine kinase ChvG